jgi:hypothetical protein
MGWSNYIIIPKLKLLVEVSRDVCDIADYEKTAIEKAIDENNIGYNGHFDGDNTVDMGDVPINNITIKDLTELYKIYDIMQSIAGMDCDKLLLFWLKRRGIEFSIESEHNIDVSKYDKEGYLIIRRL